MTAGTYTGGTVGFPQLGGFGLGLYVDNQQNFYPQIYFGMPGASVSTGYTSDLEGLLTGTSISVSMGDSVIKYNFSMSNSSIGAGVGTPGVGETYGFGPVKLGSAPIDAAGEVNGAIYSTGFELPQDTNTVFNNGTTPFNDFGLSAAGLQTAGNTPAQLGEGTTPGTLLDIAQQYLDTNTVFNNGTTPFNDFGLSAAGLQTAGNTPAQLGEGTTPGTLLDIAQQYLDTNTVFNNGTTSFNDYGLSAAQGQIGSGDWWTNSGALIYGLNSLSGSGDENVYSASVQGAANNIDSTNQVIANSSLDGMLDSSYVGNDYTGGSSGGGSSGGGSSGGGSSGGGSSGGGYYGGGYYGPIVLDLAGKGVNIAQLSSSNTFFDMTGDGYKNLTAWAGVGNGVLFVDITGTGQLTQANQIIFTKWDPGATSDIQALLDVFDTNHDGALDAGDADFSKFFVMVTNADGTQTAHSLASLGITSIDLNANAQNIALPDGSSIDGETTFTMTNPSTGVTTTNVAATVTLAVDPNGYLVATTATANADGSETIANVASYADGSLAYERILNTSADGLSKTLTDLNSGGVVATIQTDDTVINGDGSTTETVTNYAGGTIQANGELTVSGTTGSEKLNSTTTTTSADGLVVTILRDQLGGGWTTQQEVDTTNGDGSTSIVVSNLNPDSSASNVTTTAVSADGLTRTVTNLIDGITADSVTSVDATVISGTTRTETVTDSVGTTVTSKVTTVTQTVANSVTRTTSADLTDGVTLDLTSVTQTVTNTDGSTTTTQTDSNADGSLRDEAVTQLSADGLLKTTSVDSTGLINSGAAVFDTITSDNTVVNGDGSRTETVTITSANGTQLARSVTDRAASGAARTVTTYGNGDGAVTQTETVTVDGTGATTATVSALNADGSLIHQSVTATSANGLSKTIEVDSTGATSGGAAVFDHITTAVTTTSGGASTETVTDYGASTSNLIDVNRMTVSADGLTKTVYSDFTGASGVADGTWDQVAVDQTVVNGDGSLTETITVSDGASHVLGQTVKTTSADRKTVTVTTTEGTTGLVNRTETVAMQANGSVVDTIVNLDHNGDVINAAVTTTSADGLTKTIQSDVQGQSAAVYAASGLSFDSTTTETTVINADGSRTETTNVTSHNGALVSTASAMVSANGLSVTTTENPFATAHFATKSTDVGTVNADGSFTETVSDYSYSAALIDRTTTTTSANGLSTLVLHDFDGDGVTDQSTTDIVTINPNGSRTEVVTDYTGGTTGAVRDITTATSGIIVAGAGLETTITRQSNGSVPTYQVETILPSANGTVTDTTKYYAQAGGTLLKTTTTTTSADGLTKVSATAVNGDTSNDFWTSDTLVLNGDGSETETVANANNFGLISESVTTTSANGLFKTTSVDANGALNGSGAPIFDRVTTDDTALNADGSRTETIINKNANGTTISQLVKTTSADQQTITINRYLDETGTITNIDQAETIQTEVDGSVVDTVVSYGPSHTLLGTVTNTTSGNGLTRTTTYQNAAGTTVDTQTDTTTYDSTGDGGTLQDFEDSDVVNGTTLKSSIKTQTSASDQTSTTTMVLTGALASTIAGSFTDVASTSVTVADTGITTATTTNEINGATAANDTVTVVTSANQRSTTTSTLLGSAASPYIVQQDAIALDGTTTDTVTYYDPAVLSLVLGQLTVVKSFDGRTTTTTKESDYDLLNQSFNGITPTFSGSGYNVETDSFVINADGSTTDTRSGTGAFGAPAYEQTVNVVTNADASVTTTTLNYDGNGVLINQLVADNSPNGLVESYVFDAVGKESIATLTVAAADIVNGTALPSLLGTDIIESDATMLNADGSKTEVIETAYGNSFANLRSLTTTQTSANGLVTTTFVSNDGSGVYEQVSTVTTAPDGSQTKVNNFYSNASGTQVINSLTVGSTLLGSNTYTVSANGLVTTLTTSTGITDTTVNFAGADGSYEFSRSVAGGSVAASNGYVNGSASHFIDASGIDTWSWNNGAGSSGTITIDLPSEQRDIAIANSIYQTLLGHPMTDADTEYLAKYITNGVLDRESLAFDIVNSPEYAANFQLYTSDPPSLYTGFDVFTALENALGRVPTAEELATFDHNSSAIEYSSYTASVDAFVPEAVAIAQYAVDQAAKPVLGTLDANQSLVAPAAPWTNPSNRVQLYGGSYSYSGYFVDLEGGAITVNGNNNIIEINGGGVTVNGYNNVIDVSTYNDTPISASNTSIMVEDSGRATVTGNNDQIAQVGPTQLTLTSGTGDAIYVTSAGAASLNLGYTNSYPITNASNASITFAAGVGTASARAIVSGTSDAITLLGSDFVTLSGGTTGDTVAVSGTANNVIAGGISITENAGAGLTLSGNSDSVIASGSGASLMVTGTGETVSMSNGSVSLGANTSVTLTGTGDTVNASGGGSTITASAAVINVASGLTGVVVNGSGDTVNLAGHDTITVTLGGVVTQSGTNNSITVQDVGSNVLSAYVVSSGWTLDVASGATTTGTNIASGGSEVVLNGGIASGATVSNRKRRCAVR